MVMQIENIEFKEDKDEFYHKKKKSKWKYEKDIDFKIGKYYLILCSNNEVEIAKSYQDIEGVYFLNILGQPIKYIQYIRKIKLLKKIKTLFQ